MLSRNKITIFFVIALICSSIIIYYFSNKDNLQKKPITRSPSLVPVLLKNGEHGARQYLRIVGNVVKINNSERSITVGYDSLYKDGVVTYTNTVELKVLPDAKWNVNNIGSVPDYFSSLKIGDVVEAACQDNPCTILNGLYINTGF